MQKFIMLLLLKICPCGRHDLRYCRYTDNIGVFALVELLSKLEIQVFSKVLIVPLHYSCKYDPTTGTVALYIIHRNMHKAAVSWLMNIQNTIMSVAVVPFPFRLSLLCAVSYLLSDTSHRTLDEFSHGCNDVLQLLSVALE